MKHSKNFFSNSSILSNIDDTLAESNDINIKSAVFEKAYKALFDSKTIAEYNKNYKELKSVCESFLVPAQRNERYTLIHSVGDMYITFIDSSSVLDSIGWRDNENEEFKHPKNAISVCSSKNANTGKFYYWRDSKDFNYITSSVLCDKSFGGARACSKKFKSDAAMFTLNIK